MSKPSREAAKPAAAKAEDVAEVVAADLAASVETDAKPAEAVVVPEPDRFRLTVDEFCRRLSETDRRTELIGAFYADEMRNDVLADEESAFRARFDAFRRRPA